MPFCVMIWQIVSASDKGATPSIASAILGCLENAAASAKLPVKIAGANSRNDTRRNRTSPSTLRLIRPYSAPMWSCASTVRSTFIRWETTRTYMSLSIRVQVRSTRNRRSTFMLSRTR